MWGPVVQDQGASQIPNLVWLPDSLLPCIMRRRFISNPIPGALVGIELKKKLTPASRRQAEAELLAFGVQSCFPFLQVVTDMTRGGYAYWKAMSKGSRQVCVSIIIVIINRH